MTDLTERIVAVRNRIERAARRFGRDPSAVTLVAVTKMKPVETAIDAVKAGLFDLGESRVQEARDKRPALDPKARIHMIGPLQTNKAKYCPTLFSLIHSIDRRELMEALEEAGRKRETPLEGLLQINVSGEPQKSGCSPDDAEALLAYADELSWLTIRGVMTVPPMGDDPEEARPHFRRLMTLRDELAKRNWRRTTLAVVSAGMSDDFEVAIEEGATMVRVGGALFGARPAKR